MKSFSTWLLVLFMIMFWVFRIIVAFTYSLSIEFSFLPLDMKYEIILLFVTLLSIILVVKRKLIGGLLYLVTYGLYFGVHAYNIIINIINETATITDYATGLSSFVGIVLPLVILIDLLLDKSRKAFPKDKKTDWFYKNKKYDRKLDERSDKNNYRIL